MVYERRLRAFCWPQILKFRRLGWPEQIVIPPFRALLCPDTATAESATYRLEICMERKLELRLQQRDETVHLWVYAGCDTSKMLQVDLNLIDGEGLVRDLCTRLLGSDDWSGCVGSFDIAPYFQALPSGSMIAWLHYVQQSLSSSKRLEEYQLAEKLGNLAELVQVECDASRAMGGLPAASLVLHATKLKAQAREVGLSDAHLGHIATYLIPLPEAFRRLLLSHGGNVEGDN